MTEAALAYIIAPIITGLFAVLGQWFISVNQNRKKTIEDAKRDQRLEDRLSAVEKKIDIHNGYAQHFADIDKSIARIETKINGGAKG